MTNERNERLVTRLAETAGEIQAAQQLRYRVFADEMGARLESAREGLDRDAFDPHCRHLILCDGADGRIVGTYRILTAERARAIGRFYSASEFEIEPLLVLPNLVEIGRSCIDPAYRSGAALAALLGGLARHLRAGGHEHVIGCASIPIAGGLEPVRTLCAQLLREHAGPPELRCAPRNPLPLAASSERLTPASVPPLIRGYLRMGAFICGPPALDTEFGTVDLLMLLPMARLDRRYAHRLLRAA
jgi:putative hemolysin